MRETPARQLLDGWERVRGQPMPLRAAALVALLTEQPLPDVMRWSVTRRDQALFDFRAQTFGDSVDAVTACPDCSEQLEMQIALPQIMPPRIRRPRSEFRTFRIGNARIRCREPNSDDLMAVASLRDVHEARARLIARCVQSDNPDLRERAAALMANEHSDVQLALTCPACAHTWRAPFDIATFVWRELDDWAHRTLHEIHVIAGAYGWSESDILRLSPTRRQTYVEMI
jgi:hypothetical protein